MTQIDWADWASIYLAGYNDALKARRTLTPELLMLAWEGYRPSRCPHCGIEWRIGDTNRYCICNPDPHNVRDMVENHSVLSPVIHCDCYTEVMKTIPSPMTEANPHWTRPTECPRCQRTLDGTERPLPGSRYYVGE